MFFQKFGVTNPSYKTLWCALAFALALFSGSVADADRSVGLSVNQIGSDVSWGASADIPFEMGAANCDFDATVQGGGQVLGKSALEVSLPLPVGGFDAGLFTKMNVRGYSVSDLGRSTDIGAKFSRTFGDVQVSIGIFGRNGGVFGPPNALKTLEDAGYDVSVLGDLGLADVNPAPTGLSIKAGNSVNALIEAKFDLSFADVRIQGMPELSGDAEAVHQLITTLSSSWELGTHLELTGTLDVGFQTFDGELEREIANLWTLDYDF